MSKGQKRDKVGEQVGSRPTHVNRSHREINLVTGVGRLRKGGRCTLVLQLLIYQKDVRETSTPTALPPYRPTAWGRGRGVMGYCGNIS
jgi:hypothetical protein